jgi:hypothetical protein
MENCKDFSFLSFFSFSLFEMATSKGHGGLSRNRKTKKPRNPHDLNLQYSISKSENVTSFSDPFLGQDLKQGIHVSAEQQEKGSPEQPDDVPIKGPSRHFVRPRSSSETSAADIQMTPERLTNGKNENQEHQARQQRIGPGPDAQEQETPRDNLYPRQDNGYPMDEFIRQKTIICNSLGELIGVLYLVNAGQNEHQPESDPQKKDEHRVGKERRPASHIGLAFLHRVFHLL